MKLKQSLKRSPLMRSLTALEKAVNKDDLFDASAFLNIIMAMSSYPFRLLHGNCTHSLSLKSVAGSIDKVTFEEPSQL
jgi:hypothetical protein